MIHQLHCSILGVQGPRHLQPLNRDRAGRLGESHAELGERWQNRHLERAGKTTEKLAETLYVKNWTIIAAEVRRVRNPYIESLTP